MGQTHLYSLWMKAVWTTLGCWAAAAAPTGVALPLPLASLVSASPLAGCSCCVPLRSPTGLLRSGGPMVGRVEAGVMSMGSRGGVRCVALLEEGRMGMDLCSPWWWASAAKGLRRASATEAMEGRGEWAEEGTRTPRTLLAKRWAPGERCCAKGALSGGFDGAGLGRDGVVPQACAVGGRRKVRAGSRRLLGTADSGRGLGGA